MNDLFFIDNCTHHLVSTVSQLEDCIAELRSKGYDVPLYPREPKDDADRDIAAKYATVPEISTILLVIL